MPDDNAPNEDGGTNNVSEEHGDEAQEEVMNGQLLHVLRNIFGLPPDSMLELCFQQNSFDTISDVKSS